MLSMGRQQHELLQALCSSSGWAYAVIWRIRSHDSMLLVPDGSFCNEQVVKIVERILQQVHVVGEGFVGQAAFSGLHRWFFSDDCLGESIGFQDTAEWSHQFHAGVKTIALVPASQWAVVQFGSQQKVFERLEYVSYVKNVCRQLGSAGQHCFPGGRRLRYSTLDDGKSCTSMLDFCGDVKDVGSNSSSAVIGTHHNAFSVLPTKSFASAELILPSPNMPSQRCSTSANEFGMEASFRSPWLQEVSPSMPLEQKKVLCSNEIDAPSLYPQLSIEHDSFLSQSMPLNSRGVAPLSAKGDVIADGTRVKGLELDKMLAQQPLSTLLNVHGAQLSSNNASQVSKTILDHFHGNLEMQSPGLLNPQAQSGCLTVGNNHMFEAVEASQPCARDLTSADGMGSSLQNLESVVLGVLRSNTSPLSDSIDSLGNLGCSNQGQRLRGWEDFVNVGGQGGYLNSGDLGAGTGLACGSQKFLGADHLLEAVVGNISTTVDHISDDRSISAVTVADGSNRIPAQISAAGPSIFKRNVGDLVSQCFSEEASPNLLKSTVNSWIQGSCSGSSVTGHSGKLEEPTKITKKRARPGESTRPRPKDRQMIQDRMKELREIIPDGAKCSIDALLDRTIKHMIFLQNVTRYAEKMKQINEPKLIGRENGVVLKDKCNGASGGVTWAFEVGGQTMFCPILVEDSNPPGQMLVEMMCEEHGFLLEIAEIIRNFGLTILKGVMETREGKVWARFVVEANKEVTRMDIFLSLVQLLQQTTNVGICQNPAMANDYNSNLAAINQPLSPITVGVGGLQ